MRFFIGVVIGFAAGYAITNALAQRLERRSESSPLTTARTRGGDAVVVKE